MEQLEFFDIPSPCIGVCQSGPRGYCLGCYRSRDERLHWLKLDNDTKRKIVKACYMRKRRAESRQTTAQAIAADPVQTLLWQDES